MSRGPAENFGLDDPVTTGRFRRFPVYLAPHGKLKVSEDLTAIGLTSGVGSMLIGAKEAGFAVLGNIEWRDYYRLVDEKGRNTFTHNFPGAFMARGFKDLDPVEDFDLKWKGVDLAMGHPECGKHSSLNRYSRMQREQLDPGDIPLFVSYVKRLRPKYFVMDNLPQSFTAYSMRQYHAALPDYDLYPELVSNYHYGNPQKSRTRMFLIGSLRSEGYVFMPGEEKWFEDWTVRSRIGDLEDRFGHLPNHEPHVLTGKSPCWFTGLRYAGDRPDWSVVQKHFQKYPAGKNFQYHAKDGEIKIRPAVRKMKYDHPAPVITGRHPALHPVRGLPLSIRERARIQGFPDDFVFYGMQTNEAGEWEHTGHHFLTKQTGKAMPIEFNRFVADQIRRHIDGKTPKATNQRRIKPNPLVTQAKVWYCRKVGYEDQPRACNSCWLHKTCDLPRKS